MRSIHLKLIEFTVSLDLLRPFDRLWGVQAQYKSFDPLFSCTSSGVEMRSIHLELIERSREERYRSKLRCARSTFNSIHHSIISTFLILPSVYIYNWTVFGWNLVSRPNKSTIFSNSCLLFSISIVGIDKTGSNFHV